MVTVVTIATSDIKYFERACQEVHLKYYKHSSERIATSYRVIHTEINTIFLLGWMTAKYKYEK